MSAYSDYECGAMTDEEFSSWGRRENAKEQDFEVWNGMGGKKIIAPAGTFMQIFNDQDTESDLI